MSRIYKNILELVGHTPLVELSNYEKNNKLEAEIVAKVEYFNPAGSVKDRIAKAIIEDAEAKGLLKPGYTIIEPTSGNTGTVSLSGGNGADTYELTVNTSDTTGYVTVDESTATDSAGDTIKLFGFSNGTAGTNGQIKIDDNKDTKDLAGLKFSWNSTNGTLKVESTAGTNPTVYLLFNEAKDAPSGVDTRFSGDKLELYATGSSDPLATINLADIFGKIKNGTPYSSDLVLDTNGIYVTKNA